MRFGKNPESEVVRNLEMTVEEIREAKDTLHRLSADNKQRQLYEMRAKRLRDEVSALNKAKREGAQQKAIEIARNLARSGMSEEQISSITGLKAGEW